MGLRQLQRRRAISDPAVLRRQHVLRLQGVDPPRGSRWKPNGAAPINKSTNEAGNLSENDETDEADLFEAEAMKSRFVELVAHEHSPSLRRRHPSQFRHLVDGKVNFHVAKFGNLGDGCKAR